MTDADAEAMLAECRAVLPGLAWVMVGARAVGIADGEIRVDVMQVSNGRKMRATAMVAGGTRVAREPTAREALVAVKARAVDRIEHKRAELDRERAWLGLSNG